MKYRKKSAVIEAVRWTGKNIREVADFTGKEVLTSMKFNTLKIKSSEGDVKAKVGDYIVKDANGKLDILSPDVFASNYEPLTE